MVIHAAPAKSPVALSDSTLAAIDAAPIDPAPIDVVLIDGDSFVPSAVTAADLLYNMALTFEQAEERLRAIDRLFFEPDGSFVWRHEQDSGCWQLDGNLYDNAGCLSFIELKGTATHWMLDQFLGCFKQLESRLIFHLPRHGLFLDESEFRRYACR